MQQRKRQPRYQPGQRIGGRYRVHQALMGGMGEVYLCLDEQSKIPYALKTFQRGSAGLKTLFDEEVASWIALEKHPNIVRLFYTQVLDNIPFMALEWVAGDPGRGTDLRGWLRRGALDLPLALRFTIDIVRGLQHANEKSPGIVHRDLKPENVLVNQSKQAKITDFGLATIAQKSNLELGDDEGQEALGHSMHVGSVVGTPHYMPPEQWRGELDLDFRTDIYAVGCIFYELLTGNRPYAGFTLADLRDQHLDAPIPALPDALPPETTTILTGCMAKAVNGRYATLASLFDDLKALYAQYSDEPLPEVKAGEMTANDYNNRGTTYADLGQHKRAIGDYDHAIQLDPNFAFAYYNRGYSYTSLRQYECAIGDYDRAIQLDPNFTSAHYNRGYSYDEIGQHEHAIQDFDRAIQLDPEHAKAYTNRGLTYHNLGQYKRAIQDFDRAIQLNPNYANPYLGKGVVLSNLGRLAEALPYFERAIELGHPQAALVLQMMGQAPQQTSTSDPQAAFDAFQRAGSMEAMRQLVQQYPILAQMIPTIRQTIDQQAPPEHKPHFEERLAWLRGIVGE